MHIHCNIMREPLLINNYRLQREHFIYDTLVRYDKVSMGHNPLTYHIRN